MYTLHYSFSKGEYQPWYKSIKQVETMCLNRYKWKFQKSRVGFLGYVSIRVFDSDSIGCRCNIVKWEGDMNHASLNTSALFSICMCCSSSIYDLTVTIGSTVIPMSAIDQFWRFGVNLVRFICGLRVFCLGIRRNILVGTWWRLSNRRVYVIT